MARGRMINQKISEDVDFNEMSIDAQFLFMRTIPFLDRDGLVTGHQTLLWSKIAPLLPQYAAAMNKIMDEWIQAGFVVKYMDGKTPVLFFKGFHKNQALMHYDREGASTFAPPPGFYRTPKGLKSADDDGDDNTPVEQPESKKKTAKTQAQIESDDKPEQLRTNSGLTPDEVPLNRSLKEIEIKTTTTVEAEAEDKSTAGSGGSGLPNQRNRQSDQEYARLCQKFESEGFGTLTSIMAEEINALMNEHPADWIDEAMTVSVEANKRQLRYVRGILIKWRAQGRSDKQSPPGQPPPKTILPLKKWCFQKYGTEFAQYVPNVPEKVIREQYEQYRAQHQQAH